MPAPDPLSVLWLDDLRKGAGVQTRWLWHGYVAAGNVTLLTSQWKAGKTTLVSALLHQTKTGGELGDHSGAGSRRVGRGTRVLAQDDRRGINEAIGEPGA
jgi:AAA domain